MSRQSDFLSKPDAEKIAALKYSNDDYGLFLAIRDVDISAINGLVNIFDHDVNCHIEGGGYRGYAYSSTPTPLSYSIYRGNIEVIRTLIRLGAKTGDFFAQKEAEECKFDDIRQLILIAPEANDFSLLSSEEIKLGNKLVAAFHNKTDPKAINKLVSEQAPVNFLLDYGLSVALESEFVAQFSLLLTNIEEKEEKQNKELLRKNAYKILESKSADQLSEYLSTGLIIFNILNSPRANRKKVPVSRSFKQLIRDNPVKCRFNPDQKNGALIISAGLREPDFLAEILTLGKSEKYTEIKASENGAAVNFLGFFNDNAAVWATILLDIESLKILLKSGSEIENIGVTKSSLLHWVAVAARLDQTHERQEKAISIGRLLLDHGASLSFKNKLDRTPLQYARGSLLISWERRCLAYSPCPAPSLQVLRSMMMYYSLYTNRPQFNFDLMMFWIKMYSAACTQNSTYSQLETVTASPPMLRNNQNYMLMPPPIANQPEEKKGCGAKARRVIERLCLIQ